jgi:hypothetical protein
MSSVAHVRENLALSQVAPLAAENDVFGREKL